MQALVSLIAAIVSGEASEAVARARRTAIVYALAGLLALCGAGFLVGAGFVAAARVLGTVEAAWTATGWEEAWWLYGTEGTFEYTNRHGEPVARHAHRTSPGTTWGATDVTEYRFGGHDAHVRNVLAFLEAVRGDRPVACTGEDGREAVRLILASYASAEQGRPVSATASFEPLLPS